MGKLTGKVAVVTGASKGIGAAIAEAYGAEGASVVVNFASSREGADRVVKAITDKGGKAVAVQGNVGKAADVERLFAETEKVFGPANILVNNAGIYEYVPLDAVTEEHFHRHFNTNVLGVLLASQAAARQFGEKGGSIINIGSVETTIQHATSAVYTGTKGASDAITGVLANELGPKGIRVNSINPGLTATEGTQAFLGTDFEAQMVKQTPMGRIGKPGDIAPVAVFLGSDEAHWVTGQLIQVSGGFR